MKKSLKEPLFWCLSIIMIIVIVVNIWEFKIVHKPYAEGDWEAISAYVAWAGVFVSGIACLATCAVLYQNHRTIELSKKDIQNAINLQMFDKMMEVANKLENDDYSTSKMELITLFGQDIYQQVDELCELIEQKNLKKRDQNTYYKLLEQEEYDWQLEENSQFEEVSEDLLRRANSQNENYQILSELDAAGNIVEYDINEINIKLSELSAEISCRQKCLKNTVCKILRARFPLN